MLESKESSYHLVVGSVSASRESSVLFKDPVIAPPVIERPELVFSREYLDSLATSLSTVRGQVSKNPHTAVVIVAGGNGERFGHSDGKQLLDVLGKPILTWSAEAFDAVADIGLIVIVAPEERMEEYCHKAIDAFPFVTPIVIAPAGSIRQESSFSGINVVPNEYEFIVVHDGARPLITPDLVDHLISTIRGNLDIDGAVVGYPAIDTLKLVNGNSIIGSPDRSLLWVAQTPQVFRAPILRSAHAAALAEGFVGTDDSSLVERIEGRMILIQGPRDNIKMTVPEDLAAINAGLFSRLEELNG
ncbi:MAG: 2-C-methyl-D-erythritol 4-phosphate cytidylyltransferase [Coriobacteriales bacterium]|nr:2-C-methyl-D-erythritol 4-phosphate cytidylyltransferase [Coriobacteriales bacterium]